MGSGNEEHFSDGIPFRLFQHPTFDLPCLRAALTCLGSTERRLRLISGDERSIPPMPTSQKPAASSLTPPTVLFQGYDTFQDCGRNTAVEGTSNQAGGMAVCSYTTCQTMSDLINSLQIHGELSASAVFGSVDSKADYVNNLHKKERTEI